MRKKCTSLFSFLLFILIFLSTSGFSFAYESETTSELLPDQSAETVEEEHEHEWTKATCTEPKTCKICGVTEGEPKGHKVKEWKTTKKATCSHTGLKEGKCTRCGDTVEKTIGKKDHELGSWKVTKEPDGWEDGIRVKKCKKCGEIIKTDTFSSDSSFYKNWYKDKCSTVSYKNLARNPSKYEGRKVKFTGKVLQVQESIWGNVYRIGTGGWRYYDDVLYVTYNASSMKSRILEDDMVTLWGKADGLRTYQSILGASITIPEIEAKFISIQ